MKMLLVFSIVCATTLTLLVDSQVVPRCPPIKCPKKCENGYLKNPNGCDRCECNPCRFGAPWPIPCGNGKNQCSEKGGLCKFSDLDKPYCCPNERAGCCPSKENFPRNPSVNAKTIPIVRRILSAVSIDVSRFKGHSRLNVGRTYHYAIYVMLRILAISSENKYISKVHSNQSRVFRLD